MVAALRVVEPDIVRDRKSLMFSPWIFISFQVLVKDPVSGAVVACLQGRSRQNHLWFASTLDRYLVELWKNLDREPTRSGRSPSDTH